MLANWRCGGAWARCARARTSVDWDSTRNIGCVWNSTKSVTNTALIVLIHTLAVGVVINGVPFSLAESDMLYAHVLAIPF